MQLDGRPGPARPGPSRTSDINHCTSLPAAPCARNARVENFCPRKGAPSGAGRVGEGQGGQGAVGEERERKKQAERVF